MIAVVLSVLMPGLGHAWLGRFWRGLVWFVGSLIVAGILREGDPASWIPLVMFSVLGAAAAADIWLQVRLASREG